MAPTTYKFSNFRAFLFGQKKKKKNSKNNNSVKIAKSLDCSNKNKIHIVIDVPY